MSASPMTVSITFQSPAHVSAQEGASLHERQLTAVPKSKAERMAEDFTAYQAGEDDKRRKLYRFENGEHERLVALDFEEVVAITASPTDAS